VGSPASLSGNPFYGDASGNIYSLRVDMSIAKGMVSALSVWDDARLILIADPNQDDDAYTALVTAAGMGIKVRSLLHGLDEVLMETPEEEPPDMRVVEDEFDDEQETELDEDDDELEPSDEDLDDEDVEEGLPNLEEMAARADEDNDEAAQVELTERAKECGLDPDHYDTWAEVAVLVAEAEEENDEDEPEPEPDEEPDDEDEEVSGAEDEEGFFDTALEEEPEDDEVEDLAEDSDEEDEPEEEEADEDVDGVSDEDEDEESEPEEEREPVPAKSATAKKWTEASLIKLGERDREEFYAVCEEYGVYPGRGQKVSIMARKVVEAHGEAPAKRAPAKKAVAKKTAPTKRTAAAKKAPAKKTAAAKKAPAATRAPARTAASTNGHVDKALLRNALKASKAFTELAESLL